MGKFLVQFMRDKIVLIAAMS